jgi:hypothetical protein
MLCSFLDRGNIGLHTRWPVRNIYYTAEQAAIKLTKDNFITKDEYLKLRKSDFVSFYGKICKLGTVTVEEIHFRGSHDIFSYSIEPDHEKFILEMTPYQIRVIIIVAGFTYMFSTEGKNIVAQIHTQQNEIYTIRSESIYWTGAVDEGSKRMETKMICNGINLCVNDPRELLMGNDQIVIYDRILELYDDLSVDLAKKAISFMDHRGEFEKALVAPED